MMIEAILYVCLTLTTAQYSGDNETGATCAYMNTEKRAFPTMAQCEFWVKQGAQEIATRKHFDAIQNIIGHSLDAKMTIKGKCEKEVINEPFICKDCDT